MANYCPGRIDTSHERAIVVTECCITRLGEKDYSMRSYHSVTEYRMKTMNRGSMDCLVELRSRMSPKLECVKVASKE